MSLISSSLPSLANGVSQQPATARLSSQGETQENGQSSIVEGLGKRAPTHHIAQMITSNQVPNGAFLHMINRDTTERYSVIVSNGAIRVFDLDGDEKTVTDSADDDYLTAADDTTAFRAVTIADYTFLLNTEKTVRMTPKGGSATIEIVTNTVDTVFRVDFPDQGTSANTTVTAGQTTTQIAAALNTAINALAYVSSNASGNVITISRETAGAAAFSIEFYVDGVFIPEGNAGSDFISTSEPESSEGFFFVKQGNYGTNYKITVQDDIRGFFAEKTTSNTVVTDIDTKKIASDLYNTIIAVTNATTDYTFTLSGNLIRVKKISPKNARFMLKCEDGNGNKNLVAVKDSLQKFTDLPATCFPDFKVKITGDAGAEEDDYYVQFTAIAGADPDQAIQGVWDEVANTGQSVTLKAAYMPHTLVRRSDGSFLFSQATWDDRPAGDATSNPPPSFMDRQMSDIVFFRNRLSFLADENYIGSASGPNYFRFFRATVTAVLDGDPIDVAASNVSVSLLRNAVPFSGDKCLLFSDQKQFILSGGDLLTPKTASIKPSTSYESIIACKPVAAGKAVYFPTPRGDNSGLREYSTDTITATDDAVDVTAHVPAYIPANVFKIAACPNEDVMFLLTRDDPTSIFVYKYYFVGTDKLQASWSKWTSSGTILDANFIETTCYLAIEREDGVYLESVGIEAFRNDTNMDYEILLDRRFLAGPGGTVTGIYAANTNLTTFALPYETSDTVQVVVRDNGAIPAGYYESQMLAATKLNTNTSITVAGDVSAVPVVIGVQYTFTYEFSEIVFKQAAGQGGERPLTGGRLQLRRVNIVFDRTGYFRVTVTPTYGDTYTYTVTPKILGQYVTGTMVLQAGELIVPALAKSNEVTITIINDSPYPSRFMSATWLAEFILKGRRM